MKYDVVIVGSGPAGSVTARYAAKKGAKVLIIERRSEVGSPVLCAEGISKNVDNYKFIKGNHWKAASMDGARIFSPDRTMVKLAAELAGAETGYVLNREFFDKELIRGAFEKGATLMLNTQATDLLRKGNKITGIKAQHFDKELEINADIVVGADGVESRIGRCAGMPTTLKPHDLETCAK
jgi:digeranylgeranylglycerophospholipid reductase